MRKSMVDIMCTCMTYNEWVGISTIDFLVDWYCLLYICTLIHFRRAKSWQEIIRQKWFLPLGKEYLHSQYYKPGVSPLATRCALVWTIWSSVLTLTVYTYEHALCSRAYISSIMAYSYPGWSSALRLFLGMEIDGWHARMERGDDSLRSCK